MDTPEYSPDKFRELILYVSEQSSGDRYFGRAKLNKILFYSDFNAHRTLGRSITGAVYQHLPQGPCAHQFMPALQALGNDIAEAEEPTLSGTRKRPVALRAPRLDLFTAAEINVVNQVVTELEGMNADQVSELSHKTMAWRLTSNRQEIPYATAVLSHDLPNEEDWDWLEEISNATVESPAF